MTQQRACDVCGYYRQRVDGSSAVLRYGLSRQVPRSRDAEGRIEFGRERSKGGIDLCDQCWERIAKPKTRPELVGKTGPVSGRSGVGETADRYRPGPESAA